MKRLLTLLAALAVLGCCVNAAAQEYVATPVTVSKEKVKLNGKVYLSHVVLERQTLYGIAKAYGVSEEELYEANPSLKELGLQKNAILLIPFRDQQPGSVQEVQEVPTVQKEHYTEHIVRWYEDLEDIARRYNVSADELMEFNGLKSRKLTVRQVLRIPAAKSEETVEPAVPAPAPAERPVLAETPVLQAAPDSSQVVAATPREEVDFSLILPLHTPAGTASEMNMDFYSGVLMALRDLEAEGVKARLHTYDLSTGIPPVEELVKGDFVLGPVASRDLEAILQRIDGRVPVISPLDQRANALSANYRNFIQAPSATDYQYEDLAQWVKEDLQPTDKLLLITEKGAGSIAAPIAIRSAMAQRELQYEIVNYAIVEGRSIPAILSEVMAGRDSLNRVVVASESEAFMGDAIRNLGIMQTKGFRIVMYAPSKVRSFDTIEGSAYHDASLHVSASYHVDYSDPGVERFVREYRSLFRTEPSQFAFQGYDTARHFVLQALQHGSGWATALSTERGEGLHTDFLFKPDENGNLHNRAVRRVIFQPDYTTVLKR